MPGVSAVSVCSNALVLSGDKPIDSFDEENDRTRIVFNIWDYKRRRVLRMHNWNCAIKRVVLSPENTAALAPELNPVPFGTEKSFVLPGDWLRTISVGEDGSPEEYSEERGRILANTSVCKLRYVFDNTDVSTWDALLVDAMTEIMVAAISYSITKSTTKRQIDEEIVRGVLKTARAVDGQSGTPETFGDFPLLQSRLR